MRGYPTLMLLACLPTSHSAPDPKVVGKVCYEKHRSSGSFDEIQACIDKALLEGNAPQMLPTPTLTSAPTRIPPEREPRQTSSTSASGESQALDPDASHAGKGCTYFTKQSVGAVDWEGDRIMGAGRYPDGSEVAYGKWLYRCVTQRWEVVNPTRIYSARQLESKWAQVIEGTGVAPKDPLP